MFVDVKLTNNFWLSEFLRSEVAEREGIDNTPAAWQLDGLRRNAEGMELVRAELKNNAIHINSGLRVEPLERIIARKGFEAWCARRGCSVDDELAWDEYFSGKAHPQGRATDFTCRGFGTPYEICRHLAATKIQFDQLIYEHSWVHISWPHLGTPARRIKLTQQGSGFQEGIKEA